MKRVYIVPNDKKDSDLSVTRSVLSYFLSLGMKAELPLRFSESIRDAKFTDVPSEDTDLVAVIGGDGSFIDASPYALRLDAPIIGINLGKLGFLSEVEPSNLSVLNALNTGEYKIVEKMLFECSSTMRGQEGH